MHKKATPDRQQPPKEKNTHDGKRPRVSEKTLAFLRSFASSYYVEHQLPQGLQGIILG